MYILCYSRLKYRMKLLYFIHHLPITSLLFIVRSGGQHWWPALGRHCAVQVCDGHFCLGISSAIQSSVESHCRTRSVRVVYCMIVSIESYGNTVKELEPQWKNRGLTTSNYTTASSGMEEEEEGDSLLGTGRRPNKYEKKLDCPVYKNRACSRTKTTPSVTRMTPP